MLKVSKTTMYNMVKNKKIYHFKVYEKRVIPQKAIEAYTKSNGEATWTEQQKYFCEREVRLIDYKNFSLPTLKPDDATIQIECPKCNRLCWHDKFSKGCVDDIPGFNEVFCYVCALEKEN